MSLDNGNGRKVGESKLRKQIEAACRNGGDKVNLPEFTVLANQHDPYRIDTKSSHRDGEWLQGHFNNLIGEGRRIHVRGIYYALVSAGNIIMPSGQTFIGTFECWKWLKEEAVKSARWLGYLGFEQIVDNRNAEPIIHRTSEVIPGAEVSVGLRFDIPSAESAKPAPIATGFVVRQPYHFAVFGEKSSLEEVLLPICQQYEADLYLPSGEISDTLIYRIAKDAAADGRPLVLFTISDCDPSGWQMPVSIGRKLQAFKDVFFPDLEFEVVPVALTPTQAREQSLPETPLKEGEKRKDRWMERMGCEQTEIDALTIPSKAPILQRYLEDAIKPYVDLTLAERVNQAQNTWNEQAVEAIQTEVDEDQLERVMGRAENLLRYVQDAIGDINEELEDLTADVTLPDVEVPEAEVELPEDRPALIRFDHDWVEATKALKMHKAYGGDEQESNDGI